jgi:hypothetical protein
LPRSYYCLEIEYCYLFGKLRGEAQPYFVLFTSPHRIMVSPPDSAGAAAIAQELIGLMPATMGATLIGLFLSTVYVIQVVLGVLTFA